MNLVAAYTSARLAPFGKTQFPRVHVYTREERTSRYTYPADLIADTRDK